MLKAMVVGGRACGKERRKSTKSLSSTCLMCEILQRVELIRAVYYRLSATPHLICLIGALMMFMGS